MNKDLDLTKILKDCPKGVKFYSSTYGEVEFLRIESDDINPITIKWTNKNGNSYIEYLTKEGTFRGLGECTIFPSKEQRDWSKWCLPFVEGDIIFTRTNNSEYDYGWLSIFKEIYDNNCISYLDIYLGNCNFHYYPNVDMVLCDISEIVEQRLATEKEKQKLFDVIKENGYKWNAKTKTLEKLIKPKFENGDIIFTTTKGTTQIHKWLSIFKNNIDGKFNTYVSIHLNDEDIIQFKHTYLCNNSDIIDQRLATEDEKQKLFDVIRKKGYKWNAEKKVLEKLIVPKFKDGDRIKHKDSGNILKIDEIDMSGSIYCCGLDYVWVSDQDNYELVPNKFDPKTLIPFESKVLVRDGDHFSWVGSIYTHRKENGLYTVNGTYYRQCIPYNDDTAYLIGTYKEAPEYYRYWEV